ncbi:hypothetical protein R70331_02045 [Paenibacillus sp. FSL R7-0331]|nr:hypothetical protein R70331_02045 [Paenibacillus sp. FSL R7-0331]
MQKYRLAGGSVLFGLRGNGRNPVNLGNKENAPVADASRLDAGHWQGCNIGLPLIISQQAGMRKQWNEKRAYQRIF